MLRRREASHRMGKKCLQTTKDQIKDKGLLSKIHTPSRKCKLKQDTIKHLLAWPKSRTLTTQNAGEDVKKQELLLIVGGNAKW